MIERVDREPVPGAMSGNVFITTAVFAESVNEQQRGARFIVGKPRLLIEVTRAARSRVRHVQVALKMPQLAFLRILGPPLVFLALLGLPKCSTCKSSYLCRIGSSVRLILVCMRTLSKCGQVARSPSSMSSTISSSVRHESALSGLCHFVSGKIVISPT